MGKLWFPRNCSTKPKVRNWLELRQKGWYVAREKASLLRISNNENMVRMPSWARQAEFRTRSSLIWTFTAKTTREAAAREMSQSTTIQTTEEALLLHKLEKERQAAYQLLLGAMSRQEGNPRILSIICSHSWQNSREPANQTKALTWQAKVKRQQLKAAAPSRAQIWRNIGDTKVRSRGDTSSIQAGQRQRSTRCSSTAQTIRRRRNKVSIIKKIWTPQTTAAAAGTETTNWLQPLSIRAEQLKQWPINLIIRDSKAAWASHP